VRAVWTLRVGEKRAIVELKGDDVKDAVTLDEPHAADSISPKTVPLCHSQLPSHIIFAVMDWSRAAVLSHDFCVHPGMFVRELSSSHPGSSLHATPEHVRRSGKQCERAQLLHDDEDGLRQGRMQLDRVQDARLTQHVAQPSVKPSRVTHDCMHEVPLMMHEIAQPWMSDCR